MYSWICTWYAFLRLRFSPLLTLLHQEPNHLFLPTSPARTWFLPHENGGCHWPPNDLQLSRPWREATNRAAVSSVCCRCWKVSSAAFIGYQSDPIRQEWIISGDCIISYLLLCVRSRTKEHLSFRFKKLASKSAMHKSQVMEPHWSEPHLKNQYVRGMCIRIIPNNQCMCLQFQWGWCSRSPAAWFTHAYKLDVTIFTQRPQVLSTRYDSTWWTTISYH